MKRRPGLSAMLRVKNEEEFLPFCLESITEWFDEIVIIDQCSHDKTLDVARIFGNTEKTKIFSYPHESRPNGAGFDQQPYDIHNRAFFYNWCLEKTTTQWVCKWDGDMVAMDGLGELIRGIIATDSPKAISICGVDIVQWKDGKFFTGKNTLVGPEKRFFKVEEGKQYWTTGLYCEKLNLDVFTAAIVNPAFLHFKWCKPLEKATQAWPANWEKDRHFNNIIARRYVAAEYKGRIPRCLL